MQFYESHNFHVPWGRRHEPGGTSGRLACHGGMQLGPGCWVCRGLSDSVPMLCPGFFSLGYSRASLHWLTWLVMGLGREYPTLDWDIHIPKALDTDQAVDSQRLSTPLQLSQKLMGCVCCRSSSLLVNNWLPCAIGLAKAHMLLQLSARPKPWQPSQCCSTRLKMLLISLMALPLP